MIGVQNFRKLDPEELSPYGNLLKNSLARFTDIQNARYLPKEKEQALQKAIYENMKNKPYAEMAPEFAKSELELSKLQPANLQARTAGQLITNEWAPRLNQSTIAHQGAQTARSNQLLPYDVENKRLENEWTPRLNQSTIDTRESENKKRDLMTPEDVRHRQLENESYSRGEAAKAAANEAYAEQYGKNSNARTPEGKAKEYEQKLEAKNWDTALDNANKGAIAAGDINENLNLIENSYNNNLPWYQKGKVGAAVGALPPWVQSREVAEFDKYAAGVYTKNLAAMQKGHITNANFDLFKKMKITPDMTPQGFQRFTNFTRGVGDRSVQHAEFLRTAKDLNVPLRKAELGWARYIRENNFFNEKTGKIRPENLDASKFGKYLGEDRIKSNLTPNSNPYSSMSDEELAKMAGGG